LHDKIKVMSIRVPQELKNIFDKFEQANYEIYLVGGAVRDYIMNRPINDWDFTTSARPEQIMELFDDAFYNNKFGTVGIPSEEFKPHEITTFRTESNYFDNRRPENVEWGKSLEEDLERRDFTINAIALRYAQSKQEVIDPFSGQEDINKKIIRAVGDPHERFAEDALRMMRAVRIASELNFEIEDNTKNAIITHSKSIQKISKERVKDELFKILASPHPYEGMTIFREVGLMQEVLPEFEKSFGVEQISPERHHIYDVGTHGMMALKHCAPSDPLLRFACLIHDIGKPQTYSRDPESKIITFYNHEVVGARIAKNIAKRLKFSKQETDRLFLLIRWHQFTVDEHQTDKAIRRFIKKVQPENVDDMLELRRADRIGSGARETSWRTEDFKKRLIEVQKQPFSVHDLKLKGDEIMEILNIKPGPEVGRILKQLFKEVEDKKVENKKQELIKKIKEIDLSSRTCLPTRQA